MNYASQRIVIIGGGPGGYEAAMVAASSHGRRDAYRAQGHRRLGRANGRRALHKTLIATADMMTRPKPEAWALRIPRGKAPQLRVTWTA